MKHAAQLSSHIPQQPHESADLQAFRHSIRVANLPLCCFSGKPAGAQTVENTWVERAAGLEADRSNNGCFDHSVPLRSIRGGVARA